MHTQTEQENKRKGGPSTITKTKQNKKEKGSSNSVWIATCFFFALFFFSSFRADYIRRRRTTRSNKFCPESGLQCTQCFVPPTGTSSSFRSLFTFRYQFASFGANNRTRKPIKRQSTGKALDQYKKWLQ